MSYASTITNTNSSTTSYATQEAVARDYSLLFQAELSGYTYGNTPLSGGSVATYAEAVSFNFAQHSPPSPHWQQEDLPSFQDFSYNDNDNNSSSSSSSSSSFPSFNPQASAFFFAPFNENYNLHTQSSVDSMIRTGYEYEDWGMSLAEIDAEFGPSICEMAAKMGYLDCLGPEGQTSQGMEMVDKMDEKKKKEADDMQVENELDLQQAELLSAEAREENASARQIASELSAESLNHAPPPGEASPTTAQGSVSPALKTASTPARQKKYKCQRTPFCTKEYSASNGLKYHLEHGTCTSEPKKPRPPLKAKTQAKPKNLPRTESKAKEAGKVNEKRKAKGNFEGKGKATDMDESPSSSGSSPDSSSMPSSTSSSLSPLASFTHYRHLLPTPPGHLPPDATSRAASTPYPPSAPPLARIPSPLQSTAYHLDSSSTPPFVAEGDVAHFDREQNSFLQEPTPRSSLLFRSALDTAPTFGSTSPVDQVRVIMPSLSSSLHSSPPSAQVSPALQNSWPPQPPFIRAEALQSHFQMHEASTSPSFVVFPPPPQPQTSISSGTVSPSTYIQAHMPQYRSPNPNFNATLHRKQSTQIQAQNTSRMSQLQVVAARGTETSARPATVPASTSAQEQQGRRPPTQIARSSAMRPARVDPYTFSVPLSRPAPSNTSYISRSLASNTTILPPVAVPDPEAVAGLMKETERLKAIEARGTVERERLENHYTKLIENWGRFSH